MDRDAVQPESGVNMLDLALKRRYTMKRLLPLVAVAAVLALPATALANGSCYSDAQFQQAATGTVETFGGFGAAVQTAQDWITYHVYGQTAATAKQDQLPIPVLPVACDSAAGTYRVLIVAIGSDQSRFERLLAAFPSATPPTVAEWHQAILTAEKGDAAAAKLAALVGSPKAQMFQNDLAQVRSAMVGVG
jgi:hypothetical protein